MVANRIETIPWDELRSSMEEIDGSIMYAYLKPCTIIWLYTILLHSLK